MSQELRQAVGTQFRMDLRERSLYLDDDVALSDVEGFMLMLRTDRGLLLEVEARANLGGVCSRCLLPVQSAIELQFQEEFIPVVDPVSGRHITASEMENNFVIDSDLMMDAGEALRQYTLMTAPSKPLCKPDCRGLCPTCGADLNQRECGCQPTMDERWQALAAYNRGESEGS